MSDIERFSFDSDGAMWKDERGTYVLWTDFESLQAERDAQVLVTLELQVEHEQLKAERDKFTAENRDLREQFQDIANQTGPRITAMRAERDRAFVVCEEFKAERDKYRDAVAITDEATAKVIADLKAERDCYAALLDELISINDGADAYDQMGETTLRLLARAKELRK